MATLEERRRAIGATNEAARRALGRSNEAARRAIGTSMEAQRRGTSVIDDLNNVITPTQQGRVLNTLDSRGSRPAARGVAEYRPPAGGTGTGGGIASPLTEPDAATREYFDQVLLPTTDGLVWVRWKSLKKINMVDANNSPVAFEFKNGVQQ